MRNFGLVRDRLKNIVLRRRRGHHRGSVGGARGADDPRAQPARREGSREEAPRGRAQRGPRRQRGRPRRRRKNNDPSASAGRSRGRSRNALPRSRNSRGSAPRRILTASSFAPSRAGAAPAAGGLRRAPPTAPAGAMTAPGCNAAGCRERLGGSWPSTQPRPTAAPRRLRRRPSAPTAAPEPWPDPSARSARRARRAAEGGGRLREGSARLPRDDHADRQHHYEDRKRRKILTALDTRDRRSRSKGLATRAKRPSALEEFVAKYSGPNAHPENTPDAMFRLGRPLRGARPREERRRRARRTRLAQAIALYKRIIREFPKYRELAGVYYYLGPRAQRLEPPAEAQQVWRSLVCHNRLPVPGRGRPEGPERDTVGKLPQDHDADYWKGWENRHRSRSTSPRPRPGPPKRRPKKTARSRRKRTNSTPTSATRRSTSRTRIPTTCRPIPQKVKLGAGAPLRREVWWLIGDYHFNEIDPAGGPFNYNRAESAYRHSLKFKKPPIYGVAMYKLAWTYFKQQRYERASASSSSCSATPTSRRS
jgi:tetratricopeptide (TPR) repeat protein